MYFYLSLKVGTNKLESVWIFLKFQLHFLTQLGDVIKIHIYQLIKTNFKL